MANTETQSSIEQKHLENNHSLLKKFADGQIGSGGFNPLIFSASHGLTGISNCDAHIYLPNFEFSVSSWYSIEVNKRFLSEDTIYHEKEYMRLKLKTRDESGLVEVCFPSVQGLFDLRNLAKSGQLLTILKVDEEKRKLLPIDESQVYACFSFRASSNGQLFARMKIDHPAAEEVIMDYLEVIDRRFADYGQLESYFREKDSRGNKLYPTNQSRSYNNKSNRLSGALFGELKDILKKVNLELVRVYSC